MNEPRRKRRAKAEEGTTAREKIFLAGRRLFAERSYETVSADEIAREAGVAHGLLFHYFGSKLALYLEVYSDFFVELQQGWREATAEGPPDERLRRFIALHMNQVRSRAQNHIYVIRGGAPAPVLALAESARMDGVRLVLSFYAEGEPSSTRLILGRAWLGLVTELVLAWIRDEGLGREEVVETCVQLFNETMKRGPLLETARANEP